MAYDIDAIIKAYPEAVNVSDTEGAFKADGTKITLDQSLVDAARVELNKLRYQSHRRVGFGLSTGYPNIAEQLDQLWHDIDDGKLGAAATTGSWYVGISTIKNAFPKSS